MMLTKLYVQTATAHGRKNKNQDCMLYGTKILQENAAVDLEARGMLAVSYTHLDVYKRQVYMVQILILSWKISIILNMGQIKMLKKMHSFFGKLYLHI